MWRPVAYFMASHECAIIARQVREKVIDGAYARSAFVLALQALHDCAYYICIRDGDVHAIDRIERARF